jgi:hypothetical protein
MLQSSTSLSRFVTTDRLDRSIHRPIPIVNLTSAIRSHKVRSRARAAPRAGRPDTP